jgi:hypothetical protein
MSPAGPWPLPHHCSLLSYVRRPQMIAPRPLLDSSIIRLSTSVRSLDSQSCSRSPPSPSGTSGTSPGAAMNPSRDTVMSMTTFPMNSSR